MHGKFATAISCMDGRVQEPISRYLKERFKVDYIDTITEPGPNKILAENSPAEKIESIRQRIDISLNKHKSNLIVISGHYDCAGNPTTIENQLDQIRKAKDNLAKWYPGIKIIGLWVDWKWNVQEVSIFSF
jgi:carbonic anhydrase